MINHKALRKFIFLFTAGAISLVMLVAGSYQLYEYTDSTAFCGVLCHKVMNPEYTVYQVSPHSRVLCSACHIGPGADYLVKSKLRGIPQIFATLFNTYPRPIPSPVENLRPARDTCEQCHRPEYFAGDLVKNNVQFKTDAATTEVDNSLVMRVGGGLPEVAGGIHWHIAANVWYLPVDAARQEISWVGVETPDGKLKEFVNQVYAGQVTQRRINKEKRLMDCIDCHNRATHIFQSPEQLIDTALMDGRINKTLPYVKQEALKRLDPLSATLAEANARVDTIRDFYRTSYPQIFSTQKTAIDNLVNVMKEVVTLTVFPDMKVTWQTHINNLGHIDSSGCFRCHEALVSKTTPATGVSSDCNTCHYILNSQPSLQPPVIPHTLTGRSDCLSCHSTSGTVPVPTDHTGRANSTCATCHVAGFTEPVAQPPPIPHTLTGRSDCLSCHSTSGTVPVPTDHTGRANSTCATCHVAGFTEPVAQPPPIPHTLTGRSDCLSCHSTSGTVPVPTDHTGRTNRTCTTCHVAGTVPTTAAAVTIPHPSTGDCVSCHGLSASWPFPANHSGRTNTSCTTCHQSAPVLAPNISHAVQNAGDCLICHGMGEILAYPVDHIGWTNNTCSLCHQTVPVSATNIPHYIDSVADCSTCHGTGTSLAYPENHTNWSKDTCILCHRLLPVAAPRIPHSAQGRTNCLSCHTGDEESVPRSHAEWTNASCTLCHRSR